jgi:hypothetical protein
MSVKTDLEWGYEPADFFEAEYAGSLTHGQVLADRGRAVVTLAVAADPVPAPILDGTADEVRALFLAQQLVVRRMFELRRPTITQHEADGGLGITVSLADLAVQANAPTGEAIITHPDGTVTDTRAERIASDAAFVAALAPKLVQSPVLRAMVESYGHAVRDPANELVHLYEVRDAAAKHYGSDRRARKALGVTHAEWQTLGRLANSEPLRESRHRGQHPAGTRPATDEELTAARTVARRIIEAFAAKV